MARKYESAVRQQQAEQTREQILTALHAILARGDVDVTHPQVAKEAGVSSQTVYRYFATQDDLMAAFIDWLRPRIGMTRERLTGVPFETLDALPIENFPRFEQNAPVMHEIMCSRAWNRVRVGSQTARAKAGADRLRPLAPRLPDETLEAVAGVITVLASPGTWRWLRETWGISNDSAAHAASWAMRTLLAAAPAIQDDLGTPSRKQPASKKKANGARRA